MQPDITVIICTYNPRRDYLNKVLKALESQTLPFEYWELLLVDNANEQELASEIDLSWHPQSRHIREDQLGRTHALINGFKQAKAELFVNVDDDNVLDRDYLEITRKIGKEYSYLGAWGGQSRPEFEEAPPEWTKLYWGMLAIGEFDRDVFSNLENSHQAVPFGAGMCIRKIVTETYINVAIKDPRRTTLGRKGDSLTSSEDYDMALIASDIGLGLGRFTSLKLTHLLPPRRLEEEYLLKLKEGISYSALIMRSFRDPNMKTPIPLWIRKLFYYYKMLPMNSRERRFYMAEKRGMNKAFKEIMLYKTNS